MSDRERPFEGKKVYYSGSIKGAPEREPDFAWELVQFMAEGGADVLSEHVAARTPEEMESIRARRVGEAIQSISGNPKPWFGIRKQDIDWVEEATHVVALVNAPSHGVGMEIERAILKPRLGLNKTPILCLIHEELADKLSFMVRGISSEECEDYFLRTYGDLAGAKSVVKDFLTKEYTSKNNP